MSRSTHSYGLACRECKTVLVPDDCCRGEGNRHGFTFQEPNAWAAQQWPTHPCFTDLKETR